MRTIYDIGRGVRSSSAFIQALHNDPTEYAERLRLSGAIFGSVAGRVLQQVMDPQESLLDLGCGTGVVSRAIREWHQGDRVGVDLSLPMLKHVLDERLYDSAVCGRIEDMARHGLLTDYDWISALSCLYYVRPAELPQVLRSFLDKVNRGMLLSFDGISPEFRELFREREKKAGRSGSSVPLYDHRGFFTRHRRFSDVSIETVYEGLAWTSPSTKCPIHAQILLVRKRK